MKMPFLLLLACAAWAQDTVPAGRKTFESRCSVCHGADGNGGEMGPQALGNVGMMAAGGSVGKQAGAVVKEVGGKTMREEPQTYTRYSKRG